MKRFEILLFFLVLATIPSQLGKHFWPDFSFVNGIRVDYLSPTIYLSDIFIFLIILFSFPRLLKKFFLQLKSLFVILLIISLALSTLFASNIQLAIFGLVKFFELSYFAFYTSQTFKKKNWGRIVAVFSFGGFIESLIVLLQLFLQRSISGFLYFLGERTFTSSTPGIATFQINGEQILRGYGTFPHPNVAAFYLFISFILLLTFRVKKVRLNIIRFFVLSFIFLGIIATFSRIIILLSLALLILETIINSYKKTVKKSIFSVGLVLSSLLIGALLLPRFTGGIIKDWLLRVELINIFLQIFIKNFLFGVGFNNYFAIESLYQKKVSPTLLQPVHNIFLLWIIQTGIVGMLPLLLFIRKIYKRIRNVLVLFGKKKSFYRPVVIIVISCFIVGLFDHYLLTLQQAQLLAAFVFGVFFSKEKN